MSAVEKPIQTDQQFNYSRNSPSGFMRVHAETFLDILKKPKKEVDAKAKQTLCYILRRTHGYDQLSFKAKYYNEKWDSYLPFSDSSFSRATKTLYKENLIVRDKVFGSNRDYIRPTFPIASTISGHKYHIPNYVFDEIMPILRPEEFLFYLYITIGHEHYKTDWIGSTLDQVKRDLGGSISNKNQMQRIREMMAYTSLMFVKMSNHNDGKGLRTYYDYHANKSYNIDEVKKRIIEFEKRWEEKTKGQKKFAENSTVNFSPEKVNFGPENRQIVAPLNTSSIDKLNIDKSLENFAPRNEKAFQENRPQHKNVMKILERKQNFKVDLFFNHLNEMTQVDIANSASLNHIQNLYPCDKSHYNPNVLALRKKALELEPILRIYSKKELNRMLMQISLLTLKKLSKDNMKLPEVTLFKSLAGEKLDYFKTTLQEYLVLFPISEKRKHEFLKKETEEQLQKQEREREEYTKQKKIEEEKEKESAKNNVDSNIKNELFENLIQGISQKETANQKNQETEGQRKRSVKGIKFYVNNKIDELEKNKFPNSSFGENYNLERTRLEKLNLGKTNLENLEKAKGTPVNRKLSVKQVRFSLNLEGGNNNICTQTFQKSNLPQKIGKNSKVLNLFGRI